MDPLHDDYDRSVPLIVEPGHQRVRKPLIEGFAPGFRLGINRLLRIVDDEQVAAETS